MEAVYCHVWPVLLYRVFPHFLINGTVFGWKKVAEHKLCVLIFPTQILYEIFLILRRIERDVIKNVHWSSCT
jgi:hypothetical protein